MLNVASTGVTDSRISLRGIAFLHRWVHRGHRRYEAMSEGGPHRSSVGSGQLPSRPDDEEELQDAVGDRGEEEEEGCREGRLKRRPDEDSRKRDREDDKTEGQGAKEPMDPVRHNEHPRA